MDPRKVSLTLVAASEHQMVKNTLCRPLQRWIQGFPDGGVPTHGGGAPTYYFAKFQWKLHENEDNWIGTSKILLCRSATALSSSDLYRPH